MLTIDELRKKLGDALVKINDSITYSFNQAIELVAIEYFGRLPYLNTLTDRLYNTEDCECDEIDGLCDDCCTYNSHCDEEEYRERNHNIDMEKTLKKILEKYNDSYVYYYKASHLENKVIINKSFIYYDGVFFMDTPEIPQDMYDCVVEKKTIPQIRWILRTSRGGVENKYMEITPKGDIEDNYNDDFEPINNKIVELIHQDDSSIIILHGKPGTGKTSYIRNLIAENNDINFYWIDSSMFSYIDSSEFIEFIATCKNAVFILEDSESILKPRENHHNPAMQALLNISDGILGDSLKLKFICTFNADITNIDKAILRKGRLKVKYEFKDLKKDKVEKIFDKLGYDKSLAKDMPLCDIYNFLDDNGNNSNIKKIGF